MAKLTLKQKKFADEYIISGNAEEAAIRAGYSEKYARGNAYKLVAFSGIKTYIEERLAELNSQKIADQEEILQYLTSVMRGEYREETLIGMGQGFQETTYMDVGAKDRIKAAELLGKRYSMWTDKQELTQRTIEITVGDWDEED
uniref:Terminase small subunit n=1 Tax=Siphoviridae sp. ct8eQ1 TaxID=2826171 RepID=A0A8S5MZS1_9CAUD|nr:MAG TPA: Terminase small subunit [Siphoviridae sp. ct8eQ1]